MNADLASAFEFHRAGRFADAARAYDALLSRWPDDPEVLHLFGALHHQSGYHARAVELIGRAVFLQPQVATYHANLAEAHRGLGELEQAAACCRNALQLQPKFPEAANNLGLALHDSKRYEEACQQFRAALQMQPDFAMAQNNLGITLREQGQIDQALEAFRAALALDPNLALAHANLGQLLVDEEQVEEALPHCQAAVRLQPDLPAAHNNLGNAYRALERWPEAHAEYEEGLRLAPDSARIHANRGLAFLLQRRRRLAFASFRNAVELSPADPEMWQYLADAHDANEDNAEALNCYQHLVELRPSWPSSHSTLGRALLSAGRFTEAAACFRQALELNPNHLDTLLRQGMLLEELGDLSEAEIYYRRAQSAFPKAPAPLARLATLLRGKLPAGDQERVEQALSHPRLPPGRRGALLFGLAHVLDAHGDHDKAGKCLLDANAIAFEQRQKEGHFYDPSNHAALVDRIVANFTPALFGRLAGTGADTQMPVFVFGMPRSGTTLIEQVLASHSRVHGAGELSVANRVFLSVPEVLGREDEMKSCLEILDAVAVQELGRRHLEGLAGVLQSKGTSHAPDRVVDKMPDNYPFLGLLALMFPRATFVHSRRDLRDVAVSCWMTNFGSIRWADSQDNLAARIADYRRMMAHWEAVLPVPIHEVVYERLVDDFETEARRLIAACGLDWEPACLEFHQTSRPVKTASVTQVRQPIYRKSLARWKNYEPTLGGLFARIG